MVSFFSSLYQQTTHTKIPKPHNAPNFFFSFFYILFSRRLLNPHLFISMYRSSNLTITKKNQSPTHPQTHSQAFHQPSQLHPRDGKIKKTENPDACRAAPFRTLPTSYPVLKQHAKFNNEHRKCLYTGKRKKKTPFKNVGLCVCARVCVFCSSSRLPTAVDVRQVFSGDKQPSSHWILFFFSSV